MNSKIARLLCVAAAGAFLASGARKPGAAQVAEWPYYGGDPGGSRYSPLTQITKANVHDLKVAWVFHTGDVSDGSGGWRKSEFETTPIVVDGTMYLSTAFNRVIALDPETGKQRWSYDPKIDLSTDYSEGLMNRGVSAWLDRRGRARDVCHRRIFIGTIDARLIALDAATGKPCADFGADGQVDLKPGPRVIRKGEYEETSPPAIIGDLVVVGSGIADNDRVESPSGVVRAFDARTGALRWSWNPIPQRRNDPGANTWEGDSASKTGAGNAWSIISVDPARDLVFVPTGSASPDYYGGERKGDDKWSDSVVALRGKTGEFVWGFQLVHHDLWDYDTAAQPILATIRRDGADVPVVIQGNKTGNLFVLNRATGTPVFPVKERAVPQSDVPGEQTSATQPFPVFPPALVPQSLNADQAWGINAEDRAACQQRMAGLTSDGIFTPPSVHGILAFPGNIGGMNWSGAAFDPVRQLLVTNTNRIAMEVHLIPRAKYQSQEDAARAGKMRAEVSPQHGTPFGFSRDAVLSPLRLPCNPPPWGALTAVDFSGKRIKWDVPLGSVAALKKDIPPGLGSPSFGGPIITASGVVFIAGAMDDYLRAFDAETGKELWEERLPAGGQATPITYRLHRNGKQFVVIAAGGHGKIGTKLGDSVVAFALP